MTGRSLIVAALVAGCGAGGPAGESPAPARSGAAAPAAAEQEPSALVPAGFGTLRQDDFTVVLRSEALLIKVTPLSESVIRLAAPDTYDRLLALSESRRAEAVSAAGVEAPELFFVSFFSYQPDVTFQPEDLQLNQQGRVLRARAIIALTPGWGRQRLQQQETQAAIYGFADRIDFELPLVVKYGTQQSGDWSRIIPRLEVERGKVRSRAGP